jgi:PEP-CTERM motif
MKLKQIAAVVLSVLSAGAATATTTALGPAPIGSPLAFGGFAPPGSFLDFFTFTLPPNGGSGYSVSNFTLLPSLYNTVFTNFNLVSNADGLIGTGDDTVVASSTSVGAGALSLTFAANGGGNYYLSVIGLTNGPQGGVYNGAISVSAVPEPETYALMLAGVVAIGFVVMRRRNSDR